MDKLDFTDVQKEEIRKSFMNHRDRIGHTWGIEVGGEYLEPESPNCEVCALGAYALDHQVLSDPFITRAFATHFAVDKRVINSFVNGFDGSTNKGSCPEAWKFGDELRHAFD